MAYNRIDLVRRAVAEGKLKTRKRGNGVPCPNCEGEYDEVYRPTEGSEWMTPDDRWYCLCGYAERPRTLAEIQEEWALAGRTKEGVL